jgi:hypothetical protein
LRRAEKDDTGELMIPRPSPRFNVQQLDRHLSRELANLAER